MAVKQNPLKLNALQLKTLALLQALCESKDPASGECGAIPMLPPAHGNHFHVGEHIVLGSDATGLHNPSVWAALTRKGLVDGDPSTNARLTDLGIGYDTAIADSIFRSHNH